MNLPPRNANTDHLVTLRMFQTAYMLTGVIEMASGFFTYFIVMYDHGWYITDLFNIRKYWDSENTVIIDQQGQIWVRIILDLSEGFSPFPLQPRATMSESFWSNAARQPISCRLWSASGLER